MKQKNHGTLDLELSEESGGVKYIHRLHLSASAVFNVVSAGTEAIHPDMKAHVKLERLLKLGAVHNNRRDENGVLLPAEEVTRLEKTIQKNFRTLGNDVDPSPGVPFRQFLEPRTGALTSASSIPQVHQSEAKLTQGQVDAFNRDGDFRKVVIPAAVMALAVRGPGKR